MSFFCVSVAFHGLLLHLVPLLTDRGVDEQVAALLLSVVAVGMVSGRVATGFLLDRFFAPYIGIVFFFGFAIALALLWSGAGGALIFVAAICLGLGQGAELDLMAYMASRYFGLRAFGEIYGYIFTAFVLGGPVGAFLMGYAFDSYGSYDGALAIMFAAPLIAIVCMTRLGTYPDPQRKIGDGPQSELAGG